MNVPTLTAPSGGDYQRKICPEGMHVARCYQIIDMGTLEQGGNYPGKKRKVQFLFETPYETAVFVEEHGEQPFYVKADYTFFMSEKANMRKNVQSWLGKSMTDQEANSFNIFSLIGKPCQVNVVHNVSGDNTYANISAITPMAKGMSCPDAINELVCFSAELPDYDVFDKLPEFLQEKIKQSDEFIAASQVGAAPLSQEPKSDIDEIFGSQTEADPPF